MGEGQGQGQGVVIPTKKLYSGRAPMLPLLAYSIFRVYRSGLSVLNTISQFEKPTVSLIQFYVQVPRPGYPENVRILYAGVVTTFRLHILLLWLPDFQNTNFCYPKLNRPRLPHIETVPMVRVSVKVRVMVTAGFRVRVRVSVRVEIGFLLTLTLLSALGLHLGLRLGSGFNLRLRPGLGQCYAHLDIGLGLRLRLGIQDYSEGQC